MNEYIVTINGRKHKVGITDSAKVNIDCELIDTTISKISKNSFLLRYGKKVYEIVARRENADQFEFLIEGIYIDVLIRTSVQEVAGEMLLERNRSGRNSSIKAPMPGLLIKINKKVGDKVQAGEAVLLLEAMKMENEIRSPSNGIVKEIFFKEGDSIEKDAIILSIE